jgi:hypothetical protein
MFHEDNEGTIRNYETKRTAYGSVLVQASSGHGTVKGYFDGNETFGSTNRRNSMTVEILPGF